MPSPDPTKPDPIQTLLQRESGDTPLAYDLLNPFRPDWQALKISHLYFGTNHCSDLSSVVTIPTHDHGYTELCTEVITLEHALITLLSEHRAEIPDERRPQFDDPLISFGLPRNLLMRSQVREAEKKFIGAGMYLGSLRTDKTVGCELYNLISMAYTGTIGQLPPDNVKAVCTTWGLLQAQARSLITKATWQSLMNRPDTPIPQEFARNLAMLLEHDLRDMFRKRQSEYPWTTRSRDDFNNWLADATLLHEQRQKYPCASLQSKDGDPDHPHVAFSLDEKLKSIIISPQQALRYWTRYLSVPSLNSVRIEIPIAAYPSYTESPPLSSLEKDMKTLGKLPIAPLINSCWADVHYATPATVKLISEHWLHFLRSLADHNAWQAASKPQVVKLMFARASSMQAQTINELFRVPRTFDAIQIYPRQVADEGALTIIALISPTIRKSP